MSPPTATMLGYEKAPATVGTSGGLAHRRFPVDTPDDIPYGTCHCGCGGKTAIAKKTRRNGTVQGQPLRFLQGHNLRHELPVHKRYEVDPETGCWLWLGSTMYGYGRCSHKGKSHQAHRVLYERHKGPIPEGLQIDHLCRNKRCVNPDHLEAVTSVENARRRPDSRMTMEAAREIRAVADAMCEKYGISPGGLAHIIRGSRWSEDKA